MLTCTWESAQARTTRRKSSWRAWEKATMTRSICSAATMRSRSPSAPRMRSLAAPLPFVRGSPSSRQPTSLMRYSGCLSILAATVCPTSPAPMMRTRSWKSDPRPHREPRDPPGQRDKHRRQEPEGHEEGHRRVVTLDEDERDEQQPARRGERRQAAQGVGDVPAADAAAGLAIEAEGPQGSQPVRRRQREDDDAAAGVGAERGEEPVEHQRVSERGADPARQHRRRDEGDRVGRQRRRHPQARRTPGVRRPGCDHTATPRGIPHAVFFECPVAHVSCIGNRPWEQQWTVVLLDPRQIPTRRCIAAEVRPLAPR